MNLEIIRSAEKPGGVLFRSCERDVTRRIADVVLYCSHRGSGRRVDYALITWGLTDGLGECFIDHEAKDVAVASIISESVKIEPRFLSDVERGRCPKIKVVYS